MDGSNQMLFNTSFEAVSALVTFAQCWTFSPCQVRIQETQGELPRGSIPRSVEVILRAEAVESAQAGDKCDFTGSLIVVPDVSQLSTPGLLLHVTSTRYPSRSCWELLSWLLFHRQGCVQKPAPGWQGQRATKPKASGDCAPLESGSSPISSPFWLVMLHQQIHGWVWREWFKNVGDFCSVWFSLQLGSRNWVKL